MHGRVSYVRVRNFRSKSRPCATRKRSNLAVVNAGRELVQPVDAAKQSELLAPRNTRVSARQALPHAMSVRLSPRAAART